MTGERAKPTCGDVLRNVWASLVLILPILFGFPFADRIGWDGSLGIVLLGLWMYAYMILGILLGWALIAALGHVRGVGSRLGQPARSRLARRLGRPAPAGLLRLVMVYGGIVVAVMVAGMLLLNGTGHLPAPRWNDAGTLMFAAVAFIAVVVATWGAFVFARSARERDDRTVDRGRS